MKLSSNTSKARPVEVRPVNGKHITMDAQVLKTFQLADDDRVGFGGVTFAHILGF